MTVHDVYFAHYEISCSGHAHNKDIDRINPMLLLCNASQVNSRHILEVLGQSPIRPFQHQLKSITDKILHESFMRCCQNCVSASARVGAARVDVWSR